MTHPFSILGIVHTAISLVPVAAGLYSFARHGAIDPATRIGRVYLISLALSVFTSFGLSSTGGFNPGHAVGILALLAVLGSLLVPRLSFLGGMRPYLAALGFSFSFLLTLIPGTSESLTRLPPSHPLASSPESPLVRITLLVWFVVFIVGVSMQAWKIRSTRPDAVQG